LEQRNDAERTDAERSDAERRMQEALGPEIASDAAVAGGAVAEAPASLKRPLLILVALAVAVVVVSFFVVPPFPPGEDGGPGKPLNYPVDAIRANFELPRPHDIIDLSEASHPGEGIVTFDPTVSSSLLTGWIVMALIIVLAAIMAGSIRTVPSGRQNALEYVYEALANFATSLGGPKARRYVPIFAAFFLFILLSNWSGLVPFVGRVEWLRAPTSDVNTTIGLALVSFVLFHVEGVRSLGVGGYLGKFFNFGAFKDGIGNGLVTLFVGILEFLLEFVKPVTLAMRLFGNIYGGEVALGVITALTFVVIPVAIVGLEVLLNLIQALIFAVLTLMFTLVAIEGHHEEEHHEEGEADHLSPPEASAQSPVTA
jgi:F-type H+-transporting ATPase subunit a